MAEEAHEYPEPRFYTREFKLEAVRLSENTEQTVVQIARDLGIPERVLYPHGMVRQGMNRIPASQAI